MGRRAQVGLGLALLLACGYALPLFAPPATVASGSAAFARVFPGVPAGWLSARLACLGAAAVVFVLAVPRPVLPGRAVTGRRGTAATGHLERRSVLLAGGASVALLVAAAFADALVRPAQVGFVLALGVPALFVGWAYRSREAPERRPARGFRAEDLAVLAVVALWLLWRIPIGLESPATAELADTWTAFERLDAAFTGDQNLLTDEVFPGVTGILMVLQGIVWFPGGASPGAFAALQWTSFFWLALTGLGIGRLAARVFDPAVAPVATAAFLFSPFALVVPLMPAALFLGSLFGVALALLVLRVHTDRSPLALALVGPVAGLAATHPATLPMAGLAGLAVLWTAWRGPRLPARVALISLAGFAAAVLPGLPDLDAARGIWGEYADAREHWAGLEAMMFGERSPLDSWHLKHQGAATLGEIALGVGLAPFAIPRTPLRLWGDCLFDPVGAAFAALGLALALRGARRDLVLAALCAWLLAGLLPGLVSSYDRPSLTRLMGIPAPLAMLTALGFVPIARLAAGRARVAAVTAATLAVALGGATLVDRVNPRILPRSSLGLALDAAAASTGASFYLTYPAAAGIDWLFEAPIARQVAGDRLRVVPYGVVPRGPVFWSPALETDAGVAASLCRRRGDDEIWELRGPLGRGRVFMAGTLRPDWPPALRREVSCEEGLASAVVR